MGMLARFIATAAYSGYTPIAPGTVGSLVGLVILVAIRLTTPPSVEWLMLVVVIALGTWAAHRVERDEGREDPGIVIVDEVAGMLLTLLFLPLTWVTGVVGFFVFRIFDIVKPFPARQAERLDGGVGIMADDLVAGVYAALVAGAAHWVWSAFS